MFPMYNCTKSASDLGRARALIVRNQQVQSLNEAARQGFEDEMTVHLARFSPPLYQTVGEDQMRKAIHLGISKSAEYGFDNRGPVRLYLEMMLLFGSHFDTDPQYTWSAEILQNRGVGSQMERADFLYRRTLHYREKVAGPADEYTLQALRRIRAWAEQPLPFTGDDLVPAMLREFQRIYPEKAGYTGEEALGELIREGRTTAAIYRFSTVRAIALLVVLMLAFGHGCSADPLYPWIQRTLEDEAIQNPDARARRLERKALTWLDRVLAYFAGSGPS